VSAHLLAFALYRCGEQRPLVAKLVVNRDLGDARIGGNLFNRGRRKAMMEGRPALRRADFISLSDERPIDKVNGSVQLNDTVH
jgi:hypothetical protein